MKHRTLLGDLFRLGRLVMLVLAMMLLGASCAAREDDGNLAVRPITTQQETAPMTQTGTALDTELAAPDGGIDAPDASGTDVMGEVPKEIRDAVQEMLQDPAFSALLSRYGEDLPGIAAAVLYYQQTSDRADAPGCVYWTAGGTVWHLSDDCTALSRSKQLHSGSVSQAEDAGKHRSCRKCGIK